MPPRPVADLPEARKARGAFFTPPAIAAYLARWAIGNDPDARVMDPTCGEAVFLHAAGSRLLELGASPDAIKKQLVGVDLHQPSLAQSARLLGEDGLGAKLVRSDFFDVSTPAQIQDRVGWQDAVIGNPPFVRYQDQTVEARRKAQAAALAQEVRLPLLASSWAPTLVHASAFLKPEGRLAMVLPAELLTVGYAEPIRRWLRKRFSVVNLVMFERLQFEHAEEQVVLLVARGKGPCDAFCLFHVDDAGNLAEVQGIDAVGANPATAGKWSDLLLSVETRQLVRTVADQMTPLGSYGATELGTVTGANEFFAITEATRANYAIPEKHLKRISPPGTRHLKGLSFTRTHWEEQRLSRQRVWLLYPENLKSAGLRRYIAEGEQRAVHEAYKCTVRNPWWRPPVVPAPDLFFTYMSHRYPRLISNPSEATLLNSMHGVHLHEDAPPAARDALPLLALNSATMSSAEVLGRSYGGGILKMEPREAASLPVPTPDHLAAAWGHIERRWSALDAALRRGEWWSVVAQVDKALLVDAMGLSAEEVGILRDAATVLRVRRTRQTEAHDG